MFNFNEHLLICIKYRITPINNRLVTYVDFFQFSSYDSSIIDYENDGVDVVKMKVDIKINPNIKEESVIFNLREMTPQINELIELMTTDSRNEIIVYRDNMIRILKQNEVVCFTISDKKVIVHTSSNEEFIYKNSLKYIEQIINSHLLLRVSQSTIINTDYVKCFEVEFNGTLKVVFKNGHNEYVSRRYVKRIKEYFGI